MRVQVKKGIYVSHNKLRRQLENDWIRYEDWCVEHKLEVYNIDNLKKYHEVQNESK